MNDQVGMGLRHGAEDVEKQSDSSVQIQPALVAVFVDVFSLNIFEHEIRLALLRHARIAQFGNVGMCQPAKNGALALEPFNSPSVSEREIQKFDGDEAVEAPVAALCKPHAAHPALTDTGDQLVCSNGLPRYQRFIDVCQR